MVFTGFQWFSTGIRGARRICLLVAVRRQVSWVKHFEQMRLFFSGFHCFSSWGNGWLEARLLLAGSFLIVSACAELAEDAPGPSVILITQEI
jgi:hypothetical protein